MLSWFKRRSEPVLKSPVAEVVRENIDIAAHLAAYGADQPDAGVGFNSKRFGEFAAGVMWNCSLQIFDRISQDPALANSFNTCGNDLLFLECIIFPPIAVMTLEQKQLLRETVEFESFYEVLESIYSDLETYFSSEKSALPEFQQQRVEFYMYMEGVEDWFKALCSRFYQLLRARSQCPDGRIDAELTPRHPMLEGDLSDSLSVQQIAESELARAIEYMQRVNYEYSEDAQ